MSEPMRGRAALAVVAAAVFAAGCTTSPSAPIPPAHAVDAAATSVPRLAGCPLFPANNPWRRDISQAKVRRLSAAWVRSAGLRTYLHPDFGENQRYGIPFRTVPVDQPKVPIRFTAYGNESDPGPYPVPLDARVEAGGDRHVLVASGNCHLYELYGAYRTTRGWRAESGAVFDLRTNALRPDGWTSADAAGLPILPGLARAAEVRAGHIDHALRFTVSTTQRGYIHPATHQAGATNSRRAPPMGARFRLKASYRLRRFHGQALVILRCLKKYGMFVADNGSDWFISGAPSRYWNDEDLNQLKTVPGRAFEVVASGPIHR
jgi:hypothetical protein